MARNDIKVDKLYNKDESDSNPTSLVHYTSLSSLLGMTSILLNNADSEFVKKEPCLNIHASNITMMNDMEELSFFQKQFFTDSEKKTNLKSKLDQLIEEVGDLYVFSLMRSDKDEYGKIPMWKMYGDNGNGVRLKFNYNGLLKRFSSLKNPCKYFTKHQIKEKVTHKNKELNDKMKKSEDIDEFLLQMQEEVTLFKYIYWEYEKEYRIVKRSKDVCFKNNALGFISYTNLLIPIDLLQEILIGPMANHDVIYKTLLQLKETLLGMYGEENVKFKIKKSNLKLQIL